MPGWSASVSPTVSPANYPLRKCCPRWDRASSPWNAPINDWQTRRYLALIDDPAAHLSCDAEREVLWVLNGHCNSPIAGYSTITASEMTLTASVLDEARDGKFIEVTRTGPANRPRELGRAVGLELLHKGAADIIARTRPES